MTDEELIKKYVPLNNQKEALEKLRTGYPVQYIIGNVEFYHSIIDVNENVLIPRFETEYLVDKTIKYLSKLGNAKKEILEIGTGSGCISISLKKFLNANITAIDISEEAILVAKNNAKKNQVDITFLIEDVCNINLRNKYDLVISNPPYVPFNQKVDEKTKYEPQNAIFASDNGLYFYRVIIEKIKENLNDNYLIAFEIGDNQGEKIKSIALELIPGSSVKLEKDYNNFERYVFISNIKEIFE